MSSPGRTPSGVCRDEGCEAEVAAPGGAWCAEHRTDGPVRLRAERNRRYQAKKAALAAAALAPEPLADGGVLLRAPLVEGLAAAVARLDRAVREYEERVRALVGFGAAGTRDGEQEELYGEAVQWVRWSLSEMHLAARDAAEVLGPALGPTPPGQGTVPPTGG